MYIKRDNLDFEKEEDFKKIMQKLQLA